MLKVMYDELNNRKMYYLAEEEKTKDGIILKVMSGYGSKREIERLKEEREKHEQSTVRKS